jgi:SpoVK/Ycf46/Vps4 family AAA+-type ATPase
MKKLNFQDYLSAGYHSIWVQTYEDSRAMLSLSSQSIGYSIYSWDCVSGVRDHSRPVDTNDPNRKITAPMAAVNFMNTMPSQSILFLKDFHKYIPAIDICRSIKNNSINMKLQDKHYVFLSPVLTIPTELEKEISVYDFSLPTEDELIQVAENLIKENEEDFKKVGLTLPLSTDQIKNVKSAKGLTLNEAESVFSLSIATTKGFDKDIITSQKLQIIKKGGLMELFEPEPLDQLGGLKELISYIQLRKEGFTNPKKPMPKGILIIGLPGVGKSLCTKIITSILGYPGIKLNMASLKGSKVGETEQRTAQAFQQINAVSPCVVQMDEIEKMIGGVQSSDHVDAGTSSNQFGSFLHYLQESKEPHYFVATCNDITPILNISQGALMRRWDDIFFIDLPNKEEKTEILHIMNKRYGTEIPDSYVDKFDNWTGAEIEKFCKGSIYDGVEKALAMIRPIYLQNKEIIDKAREWAKYNARPATVSVMSTENKGTRKVKFQAVKE